jgi:hypothetical protein
MPGQEMYTMFQTDKPITIQRTSKTLKVQFFLSAALFWFGALLLLFSGKGYFSIMLLGGIWHLIVKLLIWWQHQ